jgi:coenzyme F420-reducing hydrogenase beta subunit
VYGCAFSDNFKAEHIRVETLDGIRKLQGSKYVQSNTEAIYHQVDTDLKDGKTVLFSGTPCQVAALQNFTKEHERLFTIDLVCHGVPNQDFFDDYLKYESLQYNGKIINFAFRDKSLGWRNAGSIKIQRVNGRVKHKKLNHSNSYYSFYYKNHSAYRDSCYECRFAVQQRCGDLTIGDYWGVELFHPEVETQHGVSVVLVNSKKGDTLLKMAGENLILHESQFDYAKAWNHNLREPCHPQQREIMQIWKESGVDGIVKHLHIPLSVKIKEKLKDIIPTTVIKRLRRIKFIVSKT